MSDASEIAHPRRIRSFVLRAGRITGAQARALETEWPRYGIDHATTPIDLDARFGRAAPCTLEIGFGNGDNLLAYASAHPERNCLGIEVHRAGVGHLLWSAAAAGLNNLRVMCHDAVEVLEHCVAPGALDEILILFPDPWHKKRHHKRRLVQAEFIALLATRLRSGGRLQLATDWEPYAAQMLEIIGANPDFTNIAGRAGFVPRPHWRALTRFERRGQRLGHGVYDMSYLRR